MKTLGEDHFQQWHRMAINDDDDGDEWNQHIMLRRGQSFLIKVEKYCPHHQLLSGCNELFISFVTVFCVAAGPCVGHTYVPMYSRPTVVSLHTQPPRLTLRAANATCTTTNRSHGNVYDKQTSVNNSQMVYLSQAFANMNKLFVGVQPDRYMATASRVGRVVDGGRLNFVPHRWLPQARLYSSPLGLQLLSSSQRVLSLQYVSQHTVLTQRAFILITLRHAGVVVDFKQIIFQHIIMIIIIA